MDSRVECLYGTPYYKILKKKVVILQNDKFYLYLGLLANITQLANFDMQVQQTSTDEIMKDLQQQDKILQDEIIRKLDIIIKQNEEIIGSIAKR